MSARTDEQLVAEAIEHLDFEPRCKLRGVAAVVIFGIPVLVEGIPAPCGKVAEALMVCNVCRYAWLVCGEHHWDVSAQPAALCGRCKVQGAGADIFSFLPLGGAR